VRLSGTGAAKRVDPFKVSGSLQHLGLRNAFGLLATARTRFLSAVRKKVIEIQLWTLHPERAAA
jgi:hypothetical protein